MSKAKTLGQIAYEANKSFELLRYVTGIQSSEENRFHFIAGAVEKAVKRRMQRQFQKANRSGANLPKFWRDACK